MNAKKLLSKEVIDVEGYKVGKTKDVDIDIQYGIVNYVLVSGGLVTKYAVKLGNISQIGDKIILNCKKAELKKPEPS
jgi:sporulation protein YlmC with PRC-barrel domain